MKQEAEDPSSLDVMVFQRTIGEDGTALWDSLWEAGQPPCGQSSDGAFPDGFALDQHSASSANYICACGLSFHSYAAMETHSIVHINSETDVSTQQSAPQSRAPQSRAPQSRTPQSRATESRATATQQDIRPKPRKKPRKPSKTQKPLKPQKPVAPVQAPLLPIVRTHTVGRQIVDLWRRYKPVVVLQSLQWAEHKVEPWAEPWAEQRLQCRECRRVLFTQDDLVQHVSIHGKSNVYGCRSCGELLIGRVPPRAAHICGWATTTPSTRFTFGKVHKDPFFSDTSPCPQCGVRFCNPRTLNKHIITTHGAAAAVLAKATPPYTAAPTAAPLTINPLTPAPLTINPLTPAPLTIKPLTPTPLTINPMTPAPLTIKPLTTPLYFSPPTTTLPTATLPTTMVKTPVLTNTPPALRCALCGQGLQSVHMLVVHWCRVQLDGRKSLASVRRRSESPPPTTSLGEVTLRFQKGSHLEMLSRSELPTITSHPVELNVTMTQTNHVSVKREAELEQGYGVQEVEQEYRVQEVDMEDGVDFEEVGQGDGVQVMEVEEEDGVEDEYSVQIIEVDDEDEVEEVEVKQEEVVQGSEAQQGYGVQEAEQGQGAEHSEAEVYQRSSSKAFTQTG